MEEEKKIESAHQGDGHSNKYFHSGLQKTMCSNAERRTDCVCPNYRHSITVRPAESSQKEVFPESITCAQPMLRLAHGHWRESSRHSRHFSDLIHAGVCIFLITEPSPVQSRTCPPWSTSSRLCWHCNKTEWQNNLPTFIKIF